MSGLVIGAVLLTACVPAKPPKIVFGDAKTVSLVAGWSAPEAIANSYCELHGKRAIFVSSEETRPGSRRWIHYFNCDDPVRE